MAHPRIRKVPDALAAECRTFDEWKAIGRSVNKGERAKWLDLHKRPVFHISQTVEIETGLFKSRGSKRRFFMDDGNGNHDEVDAHFFSDGYMDNVGDR
jgi:hypothetical protein